MYFLPREAFRYEAPDFTGSKMVRFHPRGQMLLSANGLGDMVLSHGMWVRFPLRVAQIKMPTSPDVIRFFGIFDF